jgi:S-layer homology domain
VRRNVLSALVLLLILVTAVAAVPASAAGGVFTDVKATTPFASDIEWLAAEGIAQGGADGRFRPTSPVTRQAMAVFLYKFAERDTTAPSCRTAAFRDVPRSSPYCGSIAWLDDARITSGTAGGGSAPLAPVTRQSMAAFLYHLEYDGAAPPGCTKAPYADVPTSSPFCGSVDWLYDEGVTTGTLGGNFDPTGSVTRGMMAAFLHRLERARTTPLGVDVSYPQCGKALPTDRAFGIIGVNKGLPRVFNPCFSAQLQWAQDSSGETSQPRVQLYVNTANPGRGSTAWPCADVTASCARQYGADRAQEDLDHLVGAGLDPTAYVWWLDVEEGNTWETTTAGRARNRAVLEGMVDTLEAAGVAKIGLYSTTQQWAAIVGSVPTDSTLSGLPSWLAGATGIGPARRLCGVAPLTPGGTVELVQFVEGGFDRNYVCHP